MAEEKKDKELEFTSDDVQVFDSQLGVKVTIDATGKATISSTYKALGSLELALIGRMFKAASESKRFAPKAK